MSMTALRRNTWWVLPELLALAVVAALSPLLRPVDLDAALAARVTQVLELSTPAEHHDHGHEVKADDRVICTAETMGYEPVDARTVAEVRRVYAYYLCAAGSPGQPWDFASRISGPVAVDLTEPPVVRIAQAGQGYPDRVRALLPDRYEARAFNGFVNHDLPKRVLERYEDEVADA
ncbi:hypothetical protein QEZ54_15480 [Catellatospora sp. KI3]|uniref:hypothetical protein n=1 Tax=Catellatospora sp. KI3 TaxID=3041620 RepID=UPI002482CE40|nr:hypothetical protein [Catellatospora sp. KI3]MDI1462371.1 hypothetical protein [Catellatospora sp. KI3]